VLSPEVAYHAAFIAIFFSGCWAAIVFGRVTLSTPFWKLASILFVDPIGNTKPAGEGAKAAFAQIIILLPLFLFFALLP